MSGPLHRPGVWVVLASDAPRADARAVDNMAGSIAGLDAQAVDAQ
jgi:hypothetical protein